MKSRLLLLALTTGAAVASLAASAAEPQPLPRIEGAWVRSAVAGQQGTGAFMRITAPQNTSLIRVTTPVAGTAEVHEMQMQADVMRMRAVPQLELPAGRTIELKPGGYHLMLMDLKQPLKPGSTVPLSLVFRDASGTERKLEVQVPVAMTTPDHAASHGQAAPHKH
jgi:periplasmic copper chaperone A